MSVRQNAVATTSPSTASIMEVTEKAIDANLSLGEANSFAVANPEHPLRRNVVVSVKASLNELCLQKTRGTWAPSPESLRAIFQVYCHHRFLPALLLYPQNLQCVPVPVPVFEAKEVYEPRGRRRAPGRPQERRASLDEGVARPLELPGLARHSHQRRGRLHLLVDG